MELQRDMSDLSDSVRFVRYAGFRAISAIKNTRDGPTDGQTLLQRCEDASKNSGDMLRKHCHVFYGLDGRWQRRCTTATSLRSDKVKDKIEQGK